MPTTLTLHYISSKHKELAEIYGPANWQSVFADLRTSLVNIEHCKQQNLQIVMKYKLPQLNTICDYTDL